MSLITLVRPVVSFLADPGVTPNTDGLPGMDAAKKIVGAMLTYWHRNRHRTDKAKSTRLRKLGWIVVRAREAPLELLHEHDVSIPIGASPGPAAELIAEKLSGICNAVHLKSKGAGSATSYLPLNVAQYLISTNWVTALDDAKKYTVAG
jgi:hypothetical protein